MPVPAFAKHSQCRTINFFEKATKANLQNQQMFPAEGSCPADDRGGREAPRGERGKDGLRLVGRRAEQDAA